MNDNTNLLPKLCKKKSNLEVFKDLASYNSETNVSRWVCVDEFVNDYKCLKLGNGGGFNKNLWIVGRQFCATYSQEHSRRA